MDEMKKTRKKKRPTKEQVDEVRRICEDYSAAIKRLEENRTKLERLLSRQEAAESDFEKILYEKDIKEVRNCIMKDDENTSYFRWALSELDARERTVIEQLYVDGYTWNSLLSETGEEMTTGAIDKAKKRGLEKMTKLICNKRMYVSASDFYATEENWTEKRE